MWSPAALVVMLAAPAFAFNVVANPARGGASARVAAARSAAVTAMSDEGDWAEFKYLWGDYEDGRDPTRDVLQLLDLWDEDEDGVATECLLGAEPGCCMIGPEPLEELCERLDKGYVAPVLAKLFEEVLNEASAEGATGQSAWQGQGIVSSAMPCVTVEKMRASIRAKAAAAAKVHPLRSSP